MLRCGSGAFEFANVRSDLRGDELEYLVRDFPALLHGLLAQDRDAGPEVRGLNVGDQASLEPRPHPVLEVLQQLFGWQIGGDHDLLVGVVQRVEGVEELSCVCTPDRNWMSSTSSTSTSR